MAETEIKKINGRTVCDQTARDSIPKSASDIGADPAGTGSSKVNAHNISLTAHADIRVQLQNIADQLNTFLNVDDETRNELSEVLDLIDVNKELIASITTNKVNVKDIIDNLTTNVSNKPLSAAQGVALKKLIDELQIVINNMPTSERFEQLSKEIDDYETLTLGYHTDGLLYIFKNNEPMGAGIELIAGSGGDVVGYVDSSNNIVLTGKLDEGTYTLKYEKEDGTTVDIGELDLVEKTFTNLADPTSSDWLTDSRFSTSSISSAEGGHITNHIPCKLGDTIRVEGMDLQAILDGSTARMRLYNGTTVVDDGGINPSIIITSGNGSKVDGNITTLVLTTGSNASVNNNLSKAFDSMRLNGTLMSGYSANDVIITVNQPIE